MLLSSPPQQQQQQPRQAYIYHHHQSLVNSTGLSNSHHNDHPLYNSPNTPSPSKYNKRTLQQYRQEHLDSMSITVEEYEEVLNAEVWVEVNKLRDYARHGISKEIRGVSASFIVFSFFIGSDKHLSRLLSVLCALNRFDSMQTRKGEGGHSVGRCLFAPFLLACDRSPLCLALVWTIFVGRQMVSPTHSVESQSTSLSVFFIVQGAAWPNPVSPLDLHKPSLLNALRPLHPTLRSCP